MTTALAGLRILLLEDEFLIAMDIEQLCRDAGAADVIVARSIMEIPDDTVMQDIDIVIVDILLGGASTLDFAETLQARGIPMVFASGYTQSDEINDRFPGVRLVSKPYAGSDIVMALTQAYRDSISSQPES